MLLYLDNCCFNRPYDDQSSANIFLETQAKLYIQENILNGKYQLVWSYILQYENDQNPYINHKLEIHKWKQQASQLVSASTEIIVRAKNYQTIGMHAKDALHCACAVSVNADYFITTDKQLIKAGKKLAELKVINPLSFIQEEVSS
ncbi:PIN domain protein [Methylomonas sp. AM2-LC]|uniref:PIN domain protein n=1 Tax=Methylomonas sp. AM2-LC TaxID=3153301 RepID=UPI00326498D6